jgi:hypothetical protein
MGELHDALEQIIKETPRRLLEEHIAKKLGGLAGYCP